MDPPHEMNASFMIFLSCMVVMACNNSERALSQITRTMAAFLLSSGFDVRRLTQTNYDGFEKSPISALRFIPRHCGVPLVRLIPRDSRRLELERFSLPSCDDIIQDHQL
ncbi:hypothetical protein [Desulfatiferula olefinivorans]